MNFCIISDKSYTFLVAKVIEKVPDSDAIISNDVQTL